MPNANFPTEPIELIDRFAEELEAAYPTILATLGAIGFEGASQASQEWIDDLNDNAERVSAIIERLFGDITEAPTSTSHEVEPELELSVEAELVLRATLNQPGLTLSDIRSSDPSLYHLTPVDFAKLRREIETRLASHRASFDWHKEGSKREMRYFPTLTGEESIIDRFFAKEEVVEEDVLIEPVVEVITEEPMEHTPILPARETQEEDLVNEYEITDEEFDNFLATNQEFSIAGLLLHILGTSHLDQRDFVPIIHLLKQRQSEGKIVRDPKDDKRYVSKVPQVEHVSSPEEIRISNDLDAYIKEHPEFTLSGAIRDIYSEVQVPPKMFALIRRQILARQASGVLRRGANRLFISNEATISTGVAPLVQPDIDALLKEAKIGDGGRRKPKDRHRW